MTTPANWYPDPEDAARLRYWDGTNWTEHRAPAVAPETPIAQVDEIPAGEPDADPGQETSEPQSYTPTPGQPYDTHPQVPWNPPMPAWDTPPSSREAPPAEQSYAPPPVQSFQAAPFAPPPGPPPGEGPNKKLVIGILGGAAAILLALVVVIVLVVMRRDVSTVTTSRTTPSSTSEATSSDTTSETSAEPSTAEPPTPPPTGAEGSDGDYTFSVAGTDTGDTITSTFSDAVQTTADGVFYVVYVNVSNTGAEPVTFVAPFQQLLAAGQTFVLDDQATAFLGGTVADVAPGVTVETPLVFDVPIGTTPDSITLRANPSTAGVQLPLQ